MIETLNGIFETVNYKQSTSLKLYDNKEYEDYPPHWHTTMEIIMPTESIYTIECNDQTYILREGDIILICPCCIHTLYAPPIGRRIIFQPDTNSLRFMKDIEPLLNIIYSKLLEIITLIGRNHVHHTKQQSRMAGKQKEYMEEFLKLCDYIEAHCSEDLNLDDAANMCGFSKFYFSRMFKQFANISFYKYVNQKRIAKAAELLITPENSITDVALNCGFSSLSSFIRMFKIIKGCTPTEFRNMYTS